MLTIEEVLCRPPDGHFLSQPYTVYLSFAACWCAFLAVQRTGFTRPKKPLSRKDSVEWSSRVVSSAHALLLCVGSLLCYLKLRGCSRSALVAGYAVYPDVFARIFLGYLLYDTSNIVVFFKYLGDVSAIIHHMIFMVATTYVLVHSIMAFPFVWLALGEMSTPFVNLRWHLAVTGQKEAKLYLVNGLILTVLFFVVRVLCYGAGLWHLWTLRDVWAADNQPKLNTVLVGVFFLGYLLNLYWMQAILKAALRAVARAKPAKQGQS